MGKAIEAFRFKLDNPTIFEPVSDDDSKVTFYRQCSPKIIANNGYYVCILYGKAAEEVNGIILVNSSMEYQIFSIDTSQDTALDWAREQTITVVYPRCWNWIVPLGTIDMEEKTIAIYSNEIFFLNIKDGNDICVNGITISGLVAFDSKDEEINIDGERWKVIITTQFNENHDDYFTAELNGELTVNALKKRELSLMIDSGYPLMNVDYRLSLRCNQTTVSYVGLFEEFPAGIGKRELFSQAFSDKESELKNSFFTLICSCENIQLVLDIQGVYHKEWTLDFILNGVWWEKTEKEKLVAKTDGDEYPVEEILHTKRFPLYDDNYRLYRANEKEMLCPLYRAETILRTPTEFKLSENILNIPQRVCRQIADTPYSAGLANIVDDLLAFRQARTENFVAEIQRLKMVGDLENIFLILTCGEQWVQKLAEEKPLTDVFHVALQKLVREKVQWSAVSQKRFIGITAQYLSDAILGNLYPAVMKDIGRVVPQYYKALHNEIDQVTEEKLSNTLFTILEPALFERTQWNGLNGYVESDDWQYFFNECTTAIYGQELKNLIYPVSMRDQVFKYGCVNNGMANEIIDLFETIQAKFLSNSPYRKLWEKGVVLNAVSLFMQSSRFQVEFRDKTCRALLSDRQSARLLSFIIWQQRRYEQIESLLKNNDEV